VDILIEREKDGSCQLALDLRVMMDAAEATDGRLIMEPLLTG
jgi:hypothetical protein